MQHLPSLLLPTQNLARFGHSPCLAQLKGVLLGLGSLASCQDMITIAWQQPSAVHDPSAWQRQWLRMVQVGPGMGAPLAVLSAWLTVVLGITLIALGCVCTSHSSLAGCACRAGSVGFVDSGNTTCSGDDFLCWPRAQVNLLHTVANVSGCTVLLVGDYHYSDLKVIQPGTEHAYAKTLQTHKLSKPVYQVGTLLS